MVVSSEIGYFESGTVNIALVTDDIANCSEDFTLKSALYEHTRTQAGKKPFRCSVCLRRLQTRKYSIITHLFTSV